MLGTSTTILSLWEERFGFPTRDGLLDGQPVYPDDDWETESSIIRFLRER